jgi:hypothetical protein
VNLEIRYVTPREPARATNAEPGRSEASFATMAATSSAMRKRAIGWAVEKTAPKNANPVAQGVRMPEGSTASTVNG